MTQFQAGALVDETQQSDYNKRFKHMRRNDLYRLLRDLGLNVNAQMTADDLRMVAQVNNVNVFNYVHPDYLAYNRGGAVLGKDGDGNPIVKKTAQDKTLQIPSKLPPPQPTGEHLPPQVPVYQIDPRKSDQQAQAPQAPTAGDVDLDDLNADGLKKICTRRAIAFKPNESAASLRRKLRGEDAA